MSKKALFFYLASFLSLTGYSQQTLVHQGPEAEMRRALELFDKEKYAAARNSFEVVLMSDVSDEQKLEAEYYRDISALRLYNKDAQHLCDEFISRNERHYRANLMRLELGHLYYDQKKYPQCVKYLSRVDFYQVSTPERYEAMFKLGYSYFIEKSYQNALPYLEKSCAGQHKFSYAAYYYSGYIHFRSGNFSEALSRFKRAEGHPAYQNIVPYMKVNILQRQHKWTELATYADSVLKNNSKIKNADVIYLLAAEGHFRQDHYEQAAVYFDNYVKKKRNPDEGILYRLAYCEYKAEKYEQAVERFKVLALNDDTLTQHVAYYLGQSYLKLDNKEFALGAFRQAASVSYDKEIMQESMFNVAKLSYERKQFAEAISFLEKLEEIAPNHKNEQDAHDLLAEAYLNTNDYDRALKYIESQRYQSVKLKTVYQKVSFYKAVDLFNSDAYEPALEYFEKSLKYTFDKEFEVASTFWMAEINSMRKDWSKAQNQYAFVFRNKSSAPQDYYIRSRYGIAYTYFNTDEYDKALNHFEAFIKSEEGREDRKVYGDAMLRMADCHYKKREFSTAYSEYNKAIRLSKVNLDYAFYQKGVISGKFLDKYEEATTNLTKVIEEYKTSPYADDAYFNLGVFQLQKKEYQKAIQSFSTLLSKYEGSSYEAAAKAERALAYENMKNYQAAYNDYLSLVQDNCLSQEASLAIRSLPAVLGKLDKNREMDDIITQFENCNPENVETEALRYKNIEHLFNNEKNYEKVIEQSKMYLSKYTNTALSNEINYFLGESYYQLEEPENALKHYMVLIEEPRFNFYTKALDRTGEIYLADSNYQGAIRSYEKLFRSSTSKRKQLNALMGLMKSHFEVANYDSVIVYADETIDRLNSVIDARNTAKIYKGRALLANQDTTGAFATFRDLVEKEQDQYAAEAQYRLGEIHFLKKEYRAAIDTCYHLYQQFGSQKEWVGKGFLLIADAYVELNELAQAVQVLQSLSKFPLKDIQDQAAIRIEQIAATDEEEEDEVDEVETIEEEGGIEDE